MMVLSSFLKGDAGTETCAPPFPRSPSFRDWIYSKSGLDFIMKKILPLLSLLMLIVSFVLNAEEKELPKTDSEWKKVLTPEEYRVLRKEGTERAFTGDLLKENRKGTFTCAGCGNGVFSSETKFKSGTGWPSFYQPLRPGAVGTKEDRKFFSVRTEVHCAVCKGHLGHVFEDGPQPTGLRYCINSVSMNFVPEEAEKK
jgi:peptide-methionine (R)-S-oxide reductase